jgi:3',5'-cyclic-AMP phosphodiesterase
MPLPYKQLTTDADLARSRDSVAPLNDAISAALRGAGDNARLIVWMSDLHTHASREYQWAADHNYARRVDTRTNLRLALTEIRALAPKPDVVIFGGDLTDSAGYGGHAESEYAALGAILDAELPSEQRSLAIFGNHDHANSTLSEQQWRAFKAVSRPDWTQSVDADDYYYSTSINGWRFIGLDSRANLPLSDAQRNWLAKELKRDDTTPTVVLVHRPFVSVGNWVDNHRLVDRPSLDLINASQSIRGVFSGHTHKAMAYQYFRKQHAVFPATAYGIGHPAGWSCAVMSQQAIHSIFVKQLAAPSLDSTTDVKEMQRGACARLELTLYEDSLLCDPCLVPQRRAGFRD